MGTKQLRKACVILSFIAVSVAFICALFGTIHGFTTRIHYSYGIVYPAIALGGVQIGFLVLSVGAFLGLMLLKTRQKNKAFCVTGWVVTFIGTVPAILALVAALGGMNVFLFAVSIIGMIISPLCFFIYCGYGIYDICSPLVTKSKENRQKRRNETERQKKVRYEMAWRGGREDRNTGSGDEFKQKEETVRKEEREDIRKNDGGAKLNIHGEIFFLAFRDFFPADKLFVLRKALANKSENVYEALSMLPLKNPQTTLLFSIFLGALGVDRFYIGDTGLGIAKILLNCCTFGLWALIDIFFTYKKVRENNLNEILNAVFLTS